VQNTPIRKWFWVLKRKIKVQEIKKLIHKFDIKTDELGGATHPLIKLQSEF